LGDTGTRENGMAILKWILEKFCEVQGVPLLITTNY
jgi:hypothetical protein